MRLREILNLYDTTDVRAGYISTENLSTELDSLTIVLTNTEEISIKSQDIVEFTNENNIKSYWLVGNVKKSFMTFKQPFLYEYTVDLISPTKLLEIPIPSQSITYHEEKTDRTLYHYIKMAFYRYFKIKNRYAGILTAIDGIKTPILSLQAYNNGYAPESKFEKPTLREYLDYLMNFIGYISKLEIKAITNDPSLISHYCLYLEGFNLNQQHDGIDDTYIVEMYESENAENAITCLQQDMDEVIAPNPISENIRLTCESAVINEKNALLMTQSKIYDVKEFKFYLDGTDSIFNSFYITSNGTFTKSTQSGEVVYYLGVTESNATVAYDAFYEIVTINQAKNEMIRCINNPYMNDGHGSNVRKVMRYELGQSGWVLTSYDYLTFDIGFTDYFLKIIRNHGNYQVGIPDYIIIPKAEIDLMPYLQLEEVYNTLELKAVGTMNSLSTNTICKNNSFWWSRGSNKIDGLMQYQERTGIFGITSYDPFALVLAIRFAGHNYVVNTIQNLRLDSYSYTLSDAGSQQYTDYTTNYSVVNNISADKFIGSGSISSYRDLRYLTFKINYVPYSSFKILCEKEGARHFTPSMDSNTNITTDVLSEIKRSNQKVKQLGNTDLIMTAFSAGTTQRFKIGDYFDDGNNVYTLISLETQHDISSILYKGILSSNYSNQVINTIINREKRYYSIPDPSESVTRHEKFEYEITGIDYSNGWNIKCNYAMVTYKKTSANPPVRTLCLLPVTAVFSKDNRRVTYTLDFGSNAIYGVEATTKAVTGGDEMKIYKYTDDWAETQDIEIMFLYSESKRYDSYSYGLELAAAEMSDIGGIEFSSYLPIIKIKLDNNSTNSNDNFLKDARERLVISLDLKFDDTLADQVEAAFNADYSSAYNKFDITT